MTARVRSLEQARAQTVDASAATLRRIERDLHDGTQAQLVALAMRLGHGQGEAGRRRATSTSTRCAELVDEAHRGAKEAIVELRDLARGIHPARPRRRPRGRAVHPGRPQRGADRAHRRRSQDRPDARPSRPSPTSAWPSSWPTWPSTPTPRGRRSPAPSRGPGCASSCATTARGGAQLSTVGSSSSGLAGLADRVHAVDGRLDLASPPGGPTVVTVDLPLHA